MAKDRETERTGPGKGPGTMDRARRVGSSPSSGLWVIIVVLALGTVGASWDRGEVAWTGVIVTVAVVVLLWIWSRVSGFRFLPW